LPINLVYIQNNNTNFCNFGDALSPIVVTLLSGSTVNHVNLNSKVIRMSAIGTIAHALNCSKIHVWGTGSDYHMNNISGKWSGPKDNTTEFITHACRGPLTALSLQSYTGELCTTYGDPAIIIKPYLELLLQKYKFKNRKKDRLGIVCHLSEFESFSPRAPLKKDFKRYINLDPKIDIINPITNSDAASVINKILEIASYKYILSTSLHGLIIAECFGVRAAWLSPYGLDTASNGHGWYSNIINHSRPIDHRVRDYYLGLGLMGAPCFFCDRLKGKLSYIDAIKFLNSLSSHKDNITKSYHSLLSSFPYPVHEPAPFMTIPNIVNNISF